MHKQLLIGCFLAVFSGWISAAPTSKQLSMVDLQLIAYNNNNVEAYAKYFHDDIEVYNYPRQVISSSKGALIESITKTFAERNPHAGVISSIEINDKVITHEKGVYTIRGIRRTISIVKIYQFEDGLIRRMTFLN